MADANIRAVITAEDKASAVLQGFGNKANSTLGGVSSSTNKLSGEFTNMFKAVVFGNVIFSLTSDLAIKLREGFAAVTDQMKEHNVVEQQLQAVLTSTNHIAGITAESANKLAESISKVTPVDNEAALSAENMLLTFTNIHKETFPQVTRAVIDMATAMNGGLTPSSEELRNVAIQVGKAMNDPILGVTALRRVGVQLSDTQQRQVKDFMAVNDVAGAQGVILNELTKEFGGSASAAAQTFTGRLQMLKNQVIDISGKAFIGLLIGARQIGDELIARFTPSVSALWDTLSNRLLPSLIQLWNTLNPGLTDVLRILAAVVGATVVAALWVFINGLNVAISIAGFLIRVISDVIGWVGNLGGTFINFARNVGGWLAGVTQAVEAPFIAAFKTIKSGLQDVIDAFNRVKNDISGAPGKVGGAIGGLLSHLPGFAEGGVVPGPIGAPTLAVVHGGENVIPVGGKGTGQPINITIQAGMVMSSDIEARKMALVMFGHLQDYASSKNMTVGQLIG